MKLPQVDLAGKRCLVTGGTGFIGGRLVERLVAEHGAEVRVLVRNVSRAARIARFPVQMVSGDVAERADVERALEGCALVFHCAYGSVADPEGQRRVTVGGTENVLAAALSRGAERVVNVSTLAVYGATGDGDLDESAPREHIGDPYADTKLDAENLVLDYARNRGLPATVLQPTMVYGPFGPAWTIRILNDMAAGRVILVNGGDGLCNPVYVDDVVSAMLHAAVEEAAVGEAFLISGPEAVTWKEFYGRHERMLGFESTVDMTAAEAEADFERRFGRKGLAREGLAILRGDPALRRRIKASSEVQAALKVGRVLVPRSARKALQQRLRGKRPAQPPGADGAARPVLPMAPAGIRMHAAKTRVRIDKARKLLGYEPAFGFEAGMQLTEEWARWASLV